MCRLKQACAYLWNLDPCCCQKGGKGLSGLEGLKGLAGINGTKVSRTVEVYLYDTMSSTKYCKL